MTTIKELAENSWLCSGISLSHFCKNGNELMMRHDVGGDQIKFRFIDNSKPLHYKEFVDGKIVDKKFEDKIKEVAYKYPYYEITTPEKMEATSWTLFKVLEYTKVKESTQRFPDYKEVENIISKALETFSIN